MIKISLGFTTHSIYKNVIIQIRDIITQASKYYIKLQALSGLTCMAQSYLMVYFFVHHPGGQRITPKNNCIAHHSIPNAKMSPRSETFMPNPSWRSHT